MNKKSTRYFSTKQERQIAKSLKGRCQSNSGATMFNKGDLVLDDWLIECKTAMTEKQSFPIKKEWITKLEEEAYAMNKNYYTLAFNFGGLNNNDNFYVINEKTFKEIQKILSERE